MNLSLSAAVSAAVFLLTPLAQAVDPAASNISCGVPANTVSGALGTGAAAAAGETLPNTTSTPIAWGELGAKATAQYSGDGLAIAATPAGTVALRCAFQKLEGELTREGLWLNSTDTNAAASRFRLRADSIGRAGAAMVALPQVGDTQCTGQQARFTRPGLTEEYSVSADGVRQDFVVDAAPAGAGELRVELALTGAQASASADGAQLVLDGSGRKLAYSRLRVVDATGKELAARMDVSAAHRLAVVVADAAAVYPVRIDPTFSDANWRNMGAGMNDMVSAMAVFGTTVYAGGSFTTADGGDANYIAKWNGSAWSALGTGMYDRVFALAVASDGTLYAGGSFCIAGDVVNTAFIAKWDGSAWSALGTGMNNDVCALAVSGTTLYAGGKFHTAGGVNANHIAKWTASTSTWTALGTGMDHTEEMGGEVSALAVASDGTLYAGGFFTSAGWVDNTANIAKWDGSAWAALGTGINYWVTALAVASDGTVYAGGYIDNYIAKWSGSDWSALGTGMNDQVFALAVASDGTLFAGGCFTTAGGISASGIASWNGSAWSALGGGVAGTVNAFAMSGGRLYVGGDFIKAGGKSSLYAAYISMTMTADSTTTVSSGLNPSTYGASVTFTATVSPSDATGTVTFKDGATTLGTGTLSGGTATYSTSDLSVSSHTITAEYAGDSGYAASAASPLTQTVNKATPTVTTWPTASTIAYSQTLASSTLSGGAGSIAGFFAFTSSSDMPSAGTAAQSVRSPPPPALIPESVPLPARWQGPSTSVASSPSPGAASRCLNWGCSISGPTVSLKAMP